MANTKIQSDRIDSSNRSSVIVGKSTPSQSISGATYTKVTFNSETQDVRGEFSSNTFTADEDGVYLVHSSIMWSTSPPVVINCIYKNGSAYKRTQRSHSSSYQNSRDCTASVSLVAGDTIEVYVYVSSGTHTVWNDPTYTYLTVTRIS